MVQHVDHQAEGSRVPMILCNEKELERLHREHPGLVVDCSWCQNAGGKKTDKQIATCSTFGVMVNTGQLRICSGFKERT